MTSSSKTAKQIQQEIATMLQACAATYDHSSEAAEAFIDFCGQDIIGAKTWAGRSQCYDLTVKWYRFYHDEDTANADKTATSIADKIIKAEKKQSDRDKKGAEVEEAKKNRSEWRQDILMTIDDIADQFRHAYGKWYHNPPGTNIWDPISQKAVLITARERHLDKERGELWQTPRNELMALLEDRCTIRVTLTKPELILKPFHMETGEELTGRCWNDRVHWIDDDGEIHTRPTDRNEFWHQRIPDNYPTLDGGKNDTTLYAAYINASTGMNAAKTEEERKEAEQTEMLMLEVLGMILTDNRYQKIIHCGKRANTGKSTFIRIAELLVGDHNAKPTKAHTLDTDQSVAARLATKMLITLPEMASQPSANTLDFIKAASGGDRTELRKLYEQEAQDAHIKGVILAASNRTTYYVGFNEKPKAMLRRLIYIPFNYELQGKPDRQLAEKMIAAGSDTIRYAAIHAYAEVVKRGGEFTLPKKSATGAQEMCEAPHADFASHYRHEENAITLNHDIRDHYIEWQGFEGGVLDSNKGFAGIVRALANLHDGDIKSSIKYKDKHGYTKIGKGIKHVKRIPPEEMEINDETY